MLQIVLIRLVATVLTSSAALSFLLLLLGGRLSRVRTAPDGFRRVRLGTWQLELPVLKHLGPLDSPPPGGSG